MIKEEVYRRNLKIIDKELENGNTDKARRMIREEIWMSLNETHRKLCRGGVNPHRTA